MNLRPLLPRMTLAGGSDAAGAFYPEAKATEGKAGTAGAKGSVRRTTAGTGLRVGAADAALPATSELMDATAGETAPIFNAGGIPPASHDGGAGKNSRCSVKAATDAPAAGGFSGHTNVKSIGSRRLFHDCTIAR